MDLNCCMLKIQFKRKTHRNRSFNTIHDSAWQISGAGLKRRQCSILEQLWPRIKRRPPSIISFSSFPFIPSFLQIASPLSLPRTRESTIKLFEICTRIRSRESNYCESSVWQKYRKMWFFFFFFFSCIDKTARENIWVIDFQIKKASILFRFAFVCIKNEKIDRTRL